MLAHLGFDVECCVVYWSVWFIEGKAEFHRENLDANANQVVLPWPLAKEQEKEERPVDSNVGGKTAEQKARLGSTVLAALTDLCGRTVLSPAFFLGPQMKTGSYTQAIHSLNISGTAASTDSPVKIVSKPKLYLRSHKMAGLKDLLLSEKLNTHAISLQLTAQSQVQLGGRKLRGEEAKDAKQDGRDTHLSRPKRTRKE